MSDLVIASLEERVASLRVELRATREQIRSLQQRRPKTTFAQMLASGISVVALFLGALASPVPATPPNTVRAPFVVRGASGMLMQVGQRGGKREETYLDLYNANQVPVASLIADGNGNGAAVVRSPGVGVEAMGIDGATHTGIFTIGDKDGYDLSVIRPVLERHMQRALTISNAAHQAVAYIGADDHGSGAFVLAAPNGTPKVVAGVGGPYGQPAGVGVIRTYGTKGSYLGQCGTLTGH